MQDLKRKRIFAFVIDVLIIAIVGMIFERFLKGIGFTISKIDFVVYWLMCKDCVGGASIGKRLFKIRILDDRTLQLASPLKCILRNYCYVFWIIEFPYFIWKSDGKRIGDRLLKTKVVSGNIVAMKGCGQKTIITLTACLLLFVLICIRYNSLMGI